MRTRTIVEAYRCWSEKHEHGNGSETGWVMRFEERPMRWEAVVKRINSNWPDLNWTEACGHGHPDREEAAPCLDGWKRYGGWREVNVRRAPRESVVTIEATTEEDVHAGTNA